ncbi:MAG: RNA 2',3'-cyclic phosphodiesterase [Pseudomonadota bacterium]
MHRLFVAIEIPEAIRLSLSLLQAGVPGARWVNPDNFHLTLRFIGEVPGPSVETVALELDRVTAPEHDITLEGVGSFGSARTKSVLWAGIRQSEPLNFLRNKVDRGVVTAGFGPDDRKFSPHVTLAYAKRAPANRVTDWLTDHALFRSASIRVSQFVLMESRLGGEGAIYSEIARFDVESR